MRFLPGFDIEVRADPLGFRYGPGTFGPRVESRSLNDIRMSLLDPECSGPDPVYAIAMDIGKTEHRDLLIRRHLLFGAVTYAGGRLGKEPVRSQGHVHRATRNNRLSPPEVYEVWAGEALIYVQEHVDTDPGRCFALRAGPGDVVIIPPGWGHAAISADPSEPLTFGAWCDREYAFEYEEVRTRRGLAWYPILRDDGTISWEANPRYHPASIQVRRPRDYSALGIRPGAPIYTIVETDPDLLLFITDPGRNADMWKSFIP